MSSKRHQRRRSCESKVAYASREEALRAASLLRKSHGGGSWSAYVCPFCGRWHVGRQDARKRRAMADRRAAAAS
jgi:hypothetical protein